MRFFFFSLCERVKRTVFGCVRLARTVFCLLTFCEPKPISGVKEKKKTLFVYSFLHLFVPFTSYYLIIFFFFIFPTLIFRINFRFLEFPSEGLISFWFRCRSQFNNHFPNNCILSSLWIEHSYMYYRCIMSI